MPKKFEIINVDPPYQPKEQPEPCFRIIEGLSSSYQSNYQRDHKLYLTKEAMAEITNHIGWGGLTELNHVEQGGILLGQAFRDNVTGVTYGIVSAAIPGRSAKGSSSYLEMTHETWKEMLDSVDLMLERQPMQELQIIGWYHTHPNHLSVFMSGTDQATQSRLFACDWQFAMVLNPQRPMWRAFFGRDAQECKGYVIVEESSALSNEATLPGATSDAAEETEAEPGLDEDDPTHSRQFIEHIATWKRSAPRLLWICFFILLLILAINIFLAYLQTLAFLFKR